MRISVTGASGRVDPVVIRELPRARHHILGPTHLGQGARQGLKSSLTSDECRTSEPELSAKMKESNVKAPQTRVSLLTRLKDETDTAAWREFVRLYGPVVYKFARKRGLSDADAADLMQVVLRDVAHNAGKIQYDPNHESFSDWLFAATRQTLSTYLSAQNERPYWTAGNGSLVPCVTDQESEQDSDWQAEYLRQLTAKAAGLVKREFPLSTWQAFWKTEVDGLPAQDVGLELKMTAGAVYVAKSRVLARLHGEVRRLQTEAGAW